AGARSRRRGRGGTAYPGTRPSALRDARAVRPPWDCSRHRRRADRRTARDVRAVGGTRCRRGGGRARVRDSETFTTETRAHAGITVPMLLVLGGLSAVPPLSFDMYLPALPQVADSLGAPEAQIQLTLSPCLL